MQGSRARAKGHWGIVLLISESRIFPVPYLYFKDNLSSIGGLLNPCTCSFKPNKANLGLQIDFFVLFLHPLPTQVLPNNGKFPWRAAHFLPPNHRWPGEPRKTWPRSSQVVPFTKAKNPGNSLGREPRAGWHTLPDLDCNNCNHNLTWRPVWGLSLPLSWDTRVFTFVPLAMGAIKWWLDSLHVEADSTLPAYLHHTPTEVDSLHS